MSDDNTSQTVDPIGAALGSVWIRFAISLLAITGIILRWRYRDGKEFSYSDLILIGIAIIPWIGEFVASLRFGKDGGEIVFLKQKVEEANQTAKAALNASVQGVGGVLPNATTTKLLPSGEESSMKDSKISENDDPQKGKWGGQPVANGRQLSASIKPIPNQDYVRRVILTVSSTNPAKPLDGKVTFHLHPTFNRLNFDVPVVEGIAKTTLISYGAFTVGAEADNGETRLEFDLTSLDDGKDQFFTR